MKNGLVFLIPTYLSESNDRNFLAPLVLDIIKNIDYFLVENVRTARRFISSLNLGLDISALRFELVDKNTPPAVISKLLAPTKSGTDAGVMAEAGLPGLADPGGLVVSWAHKNGTRVVPLPGATSIQTAVIASGFSGQQYTFHGYLPIQKNERTKTIKTLEQTIQKTGYTQVFMETPFRNMSLLEDLLKTLTPATHLHISSDLFGKKEFIKTLTAREWQLNLPDLHKVPSVFCIGQLS